MNGYCLKLNVKYFRWQEHVYEQTIIHIKGENIDWCCVCHHEYEEIVDKFGKCWLAKRHQRPLPTNCCSLRGNAMCIFISIYRRRTDNIMVKRKRTAVYKFKSIKNRVQSNLCNPALHYNIPVGYSFSGDCATRFMCMLFRSLFVLLSLILLAIVLFVLRFTDSDYPFGIFKLCLAYSLTAKGNQIWKAHSF